MSQETIAYSTEVTKQKSTTITPQLRKVIALESLSNRTTVTEIAQTHGISRKSVHAQKNKALSEIDEAFQGDQAEDNEKVLFTINVTKSWLRQFIICLVLCCHSSFRGIIEVFSTLIDTDISLGTIHNVVTEAVAKARLINAQEDLSGIRRGALDEIFQGSKPVLVGNDPDSLYTYLLQATSNRDGDTWGYHLLELQERGFNPDYTIADFGKGLRKGQELAFPGVPCYGDVFHAEMDMGKLSRLLDNKAYSTIAAHDKMEKAMARSKKKNQGNKYSKKLSAARTKMHQAIQLADDISTLASWLWETLAISGPSFETRKEVLEFIIQELQNLEPQCPYRIKPVRLKLANHVDELLGFAKLLDEALLKLGAKLQISSADLRALLMLEGKGYDDPSYWEMEQDLWTKFGDKFYKARQELRKIMASVTRASSCVENLNSRLRPYFFLRKRVGEESLELLRFFLNHKRFSRSRVSHRRGWSPAELLQKRRLPHWIEMLGFEKFQRAVA